MTPSNRAALALLTALLACGLSTLAATLLIICRLIYLATQAAP